MKTFVQVSVQISLQISAQVSAQVTVQAVVHLFSDQKIGMHHKVTSGGIGGQAFVARPMAAPDEPDSLAGVSRCIGAAGTGLEGLSPGFSGHPNACHTAQYLWVVVKTSSARPINPKAKPAAAGGAMEYTQRWNRQSAEWWWWPWWSAALPWAWPAC
jgi:hypothetical protein